MSKVIIIGGGASGLASAITASRNNNEVILIERNKDLAKKILATGNGHCNLFNDEFIPEKYHSTNKELIEEIINQDNKEKIEAFFQTIGLVPKIKDGYYYPLSNQATTVKELLITELSKLNVEVHLEEQVLDIIKEEDGYIVKTNNSLYQSNKVIIATGGMASPKTGSDGNGYSLVEKLNHTIIKPLPSIVQLIGKGNFFKDWSGIRNQVTIKLLENNKLKATETGEIQLTDYGISGICSMQLSSIITRGLDNNKNEKVIINFLSELFQEEQDFLNYLTFRNTFLKDRTIQELLDGILNYKLTNLFLKTTNIDKTKTLDELTVTEKKTLVKTIISFELEIIGTKDFNFAQVTSGGVPLTEINLNTMESKISNGLYLVGEIVDIDGNCGGYNLGFAWLSGILAGKDIKE